MRRKNVHCTVLRTLETDLVDYANGGEECSICFFGSRGDFICRLIISLLNNVCFVVLG